MTRPVTHDHDVPAACCAGEGGCAAALPKDAAMGLLSSGAVAAIGLGFLRKASGHLGTHTILPVAVLPVVLLPGG